MSGSISATTLAYVGAAAAVAGAATTAAGQMQQASAAKASANYQSEVADSNAAIANQNASYTAAEGEQQAAIQEQKTRTQEGQILTGQASSGIDVNSPTSSAVRTSESVLGAEDAQTIRSNAARQAYGYETQSTNFKNQSSADTAQGNNAEISGYIGTGSGLLNSAGNASLNYADVMNKVTGVNNSGSINPASGQVNP